jgi:hypothetical protein
VPPRIFAGVADRGRRSQGQGRRPSGQSKTTIKIAATTTKVSATAIVVDRIDWRTKIKARLLTGLLVGDPTEIKSEFGRQIAVDLEANANLNECGCIPSHVRPP